jgi:hypothetical protein
MASNTPRPAGQRQRAKQQAARQRSRFRPRQMKKVHGEFFGRLLKS